MSLEDKLLEYIRKEFGRDDEREITADTMLISSGIIDSFSLVSLQAFIEREFGKKIPAAWITVESFDSVAQMAEVIRD